MCCIRYLVERGIRRRNDVRGDPLLPPPGLDVKKSPTSHNTAKSARALPTLVDLPFNDRGNLGILITDSSVYSCATFKSTPSVLFPHAPDYAGPTEQPGPERSRSLQPAPNAFSHRRRPEVGDVLPAQPKGAQAIPR